MSQSKRMQPTQLSSCFLPLLMLLPYALMRRQGWQGIANLGQATGWRWSAGALLFLIPAGLYWVVRLTHPDVQITIGRHEPGLATLGVGIALSRDEESAPRSDFGGVTQTLSLGF